MTLHYAAHLPVWLHQFLGLNLLCHVTTVAIWSVPFSRLCP
jgi:hypothetical protein